MSPERILMLTKAALIVFTVALLASVAVVISSFVTGVSTVDGERLSRLGSALVLAFVVPVLVLSATIARRRGR
jgi:hypothetical protein